MNSQIGNEMHKFVNFIFKYVNLNTKITIKVKKDRKKVNFVVYSANEL